jgi:hypothetical protein
MGGTMLHEIGVLFHLYPELTVVAIFISGFFTAFAAVYTYFKDRTSRHISLSNLYVLFTDRYNSKQMYDSVKTLTDYYKKNRKTFHQRWKEDEASHASFVEDLRVAMRVVDRFYFDIAHLYDAKYISKGFARLLCSQWGINVFYKICIPLNEVTIPKNEKDYCKILRRVRRKYGDGEIF